MIRMSELESGKRGLAIVGLGYVGLSLVGGFGKAFGRVLGFDINKERVAELQKGIDRNKELTPGDLKRLSVEYTTNPAKLRESSFTIIAVPTPVDDNKLPDLSALKLASSIVGENLTRGSIVVYESTVYPGVTEDICMPILEETSKFRCGKDFKVGYSPERINPGDRTHSLQNVIKIVAGQDGETTRYIANVYKKVVKANIYEAPNIKTAEAAKVIENIQRDINIALINEIAIICSGMGLDTQEVLSAAGTKWNFMRFEPGLVGGHCLSVDPYYLAHKSLQIGHYPEVILAGRKVNNYIGKYVAHRMIKNLIQAGKSLKDCKVLILGIAFKENVCDTRNSKVVDIAEELKEYGVHVLVHDPVVTRTEVLKRYPSLEFVERCEEANPYDGIVAAVKHDVFIKGSLKRLRKLCNSNPILEDVKGVFPRREAVKLGFRYSRL